MKIGILSRGPQNHSTRSLSEAAQRIGHTAEILDPFGFYLHIGGTGNRITYYGKPAADFDIVIPCLSRTTVQYGEEVVAHFDAYIRIAIEATLELELPGVDLLGTNEAPIVLESTHR